MSLQLLPLDYVRLPYKSGHNLQYYFLGNFIDIAFKIQKLPI